MKGQRYQADTLLDLMYIYISLLSQALRWSSLGLFQSKSKGESTVTDMYDLRGRPLFCIGKVTETTFLI